MCLTENRLQVLINEQGSRALRDSKHFKTEVAQTVKTYQNSSIFDKSIYSQVTDLIVIRKTVKSKVEKKPSWIEDLHFLVDITSENFNRSHLVLALNLIQPLTN